MFVLATQRSERNCCEESSLRALSYINNSIIAHSRYHNSGGLQEQVAIADFQQRWHERQKAEQEK